MSSGCRFAARFSQQGSQRIAFATSLQIDATTPAEITQHFEQAALRDHAAVVVFPGIRREADIRTLLEVLDDDDRWGTAAVPSRLPERDAIGLHWETAAGTWSRTMGLAPLLTMPVTRRAPYVAIAAWPGPPKNPGAKWVGFADMPSGLGPKHRETLDRTFALSGDMLTDDPDRDALREIAFCLQRGAPSL